MIELTDADLQETIDAGELPGKIVNSRNRVAVVLTQSWCPQWMMMKRWLRNVKEEELNIYWVEYEKTDMYQPFMRFKENVFLNFQVPYVRYYRDGKFTGDSNYCNRESFLHSLGL